MYASVDAIKMPDGIALGEYYTAQVWDTQRGEFEALLESAGHVPCKFDVQWSTQPATAWNDIRRRNSAASTRRPRSAIAVRVAKRSPAIWQRHSHAKHHCYGARFDAAISHTLWLWLMAALLQTLLLLPSQAPFDLPCSSQRVLVAGTLATGATMVAAAVVAWRQQLAVQGSVLGATAFRRPQWPTAMR